MWASVTLGVSFCTETSVYAVFFSSYSEEEEEELDEDEEDLTIYSYNYDKRFNNLIKSPIEAPRQISMLS